MRFAFFLLFLVWPGTGVQAEYRAYKLHIGKPDAEPREVISTLDHVQYTGYYPVNPGEVVTYVDSWMCWARSEAYEPLCAQPTPTEAAPTPERKPSSK